jgi:hypothetical protein
MSRYVYLLQGEEAKEKRTQIWPISTSSFMLNRKTFSPHKSVDSGLPCHSCCRHVYQS